MTFLYIINVDKTNILKQSIFLGFRSGVERFYIEDSLKSQLNKHG